MSGTNSAGTHEVSSVALLRHVLGQRSLWDGYHDARRGLPPRPWVDDWPTDQQIYYEQGRMVVAHMLAEGFPPPAMVRSEDLAAFGQWLWGWLQRSTEPMLPEDWVVPEEELT